MGLCLLVKVSFIRFLCLLRSYTHIWYRSSVLSNWPLFPVWSISSVLLIVLYVLHTPVLLILFIVVLTVRIVYIIWNTQQDAKHKDIFTIAIYPHWGGGEVLPLQTPGPLAFVTA
jgi:hypothetical protein